MPSIVQCNPGEGALDELNPPYFPSGSSFAADLASAHGFWDDFGRLGCHKNEKSRSKPFPKRVSVGTYRPHPPALAAGCLLRKPWDERNGAAAALVHPVSRKWFSLKARNGLSRGGAAR